MCLFHPEVVKLVLNHLLMVHIIDEFELVGSVHEIFFGHEEAFSTANALNRPLSCSFLFNELF